MPQYGRNPANLPPRTCPTCAVVFQPYRDNQKACSRSCRAKLPEVRAVTKLQFANPELRERKNAARRVATNPGRKAVNMASMLKSLYGLSIEQYQAMLLAQGGCCAICNQPPDPNGVKAASRLHVDHDHGTGAVRALLCGRCNRGLGYFKDDAVRLRVAADYIEKHKGAT